jgi:hypothetical protein
LLLKGGAVCAHAAIAEKIKKVEYNILCFILFENRLIK